MLRCNYSTVEHVIAYIKILRQSLETRDTRLTIKNVSYFLSKSIFLAILI